MADLRKAIWTNMTSWSAIGNIIGAPPTARLYPVVAPASATLPYVTYRQIDHTSVRHFTGNSGLGQYTYEFELVAADEVTLWTLLEAIRTNFDAQRLAIEGETFQTYLSSVLDTTAPPVDGKASPRYSATMIFDIWYTEDT